MAYIPRNVDGISIRTAAHGFGIPHKELRNLIKRLRLQLPRDANGWCFIDPPAMHEIEKVLGADPQWLQKRLDGPFYYSRRDNRRPTPRMHAKALPDPTAPMTCQVCGSGPGRALPETEACVACGDGMDTVSAAAQFGGPNVVDPSLPPPPWVPPWALPWPPQRS